jgi:TetR/AcrR family transcriptional regulator, cholesterol catabolism regulator
MKKMRARKGISFDTAVPKQAQRINTIARISAELFSSKGYVETSIDDIAAGAKVTKGGIYHYFGSKTDILYFICSTYIDLDLENLEQSLNAIESTDEKVKFIIFRHIDHYTTHVFAAKTLLNEAHNLPLRYFKKVKARERQYYKIVAGVLSQHPNIGVRKDVVTALTFTLFGMMNWMYSWYDPKGGIKPEELSQLIYEVFTNGVNGPLLIGREIGWLKGKSSRTSEHGIRHSVRGMKVRKTGRAFDPVQGSNGNGYARSRRSES